MTAPLTPQSTIPLPGNLRIPQLGFGVYRSPPSLTSASVTHALEAGYRHIDTAQIYRNEEEVGFAVRQFLDRSGSGGEGLRREDVWITTKLRDARGKFPKKLDDVPMLLRESVERISGKTVEEGGYVDLFLIHSPYAGSEGRAEQWRNLEALKRDGGARALGVSNFGVRHLEEMKTYAQEPVAVNQIELHPWCRQKEIVAYCQEHNIAIEAYSPLAQGKYADDPVLMGVAKEVGRTWAQVLIRWSLQHGFIPLPKSDTPERIIENAQVWDVSLDDSQMARLDSLDVDDHVCWNPTDCP